MNKEYKYIDDLIIRYPELEVCKKDIIDSYVLLVDCFKNGNKLLVAGNGGSAADALHIVGELMKAFVLPRKLTRELCKAIEPICDRADYLKQNLQMALPAIALVSEIGLTTAFSNDVAPDLVFAQQILGYGNKGDIFLAISTSGNSKNIVYAATVAKAKGIKVIALTGAKDSNLSELADVTIRSVQIETYLIQEHHLPIYHCLCLMLEYRFFGE